MNRNFLETAGRVNAPLRTPTAEVVVTRRAFAASPLQTWNGLIFYEEIGRRPPFLLRLLLPQPLRAEGRKSAVGDVARCVYEGGYLVKGVTGSEATRRYQFEVSEQALEIGRGIRLLGGSYVLRELPDGRTEVALSTCFRSPRRPRWLWKRIEAAVCHHFHSFILSAMSERIEARRGFDEETPST